MAGLSCMCCNILVPVLIAVVSVKILLSLFPGLRGQLWTWFVDRMCRGVHGSIRDRKQRLFSELKELRASSNCSKDKPFTILEVGVGSGLNFDFYPDDCTVICLEPETLFEAYVKPKMSSYPGITLRDFVIGEAENMSFLPDNSVDAVICTFVMCSAKDTDQALKEFKRVLKPGGLYTFIEHVGAHHHSPLRKLQHLANHVMGAVHKQAGCLTRDTETNIRRAGYSRVEVERFDMPRTWNPMTRLAKPLIMGTATK